MPPKDCLKYKRIEILIDYNTFLFHFILSNLKLQQKTTLLKLKKVLEQFLAKTHAIDKD